ncbi:MAG: hypothetical protein U9O85_05415 [Euryarchaeota archaeon]|nr:hypothetical protein [Euryarchaeota archaeon]
MEITFVTAVIALLITGLGVGVGGCFIMIPVQYIYNGLMAGVYGAYPIGHLIGYVNPESWLALAATNVPMAQVGVRVAHKLPAKELKYVFIAVMKGECHENYNISIEPRNSL